MKYVYSIANAYCMDTYIILYACMHVHMHTCIHACKYSHNSIDITTEQSFRCIELTGAKIWICKNTSCQAFTNQATYLH